jgi:hypothetical protein
MVRPNGSTDPADLNKAANGEWVYGNEEDVSFLQINKFADFRTVADTGLRIERRVESGFLLNSSVIRDAERVTAEEVRFAAQELESTLGGVYTTLAQEFQLPLIKQILAKLKKDKAIPELDALKGHVDPVIVTGLDALGRSADLERLRQSFGALVEIVGPQTVVSRVNLDVLFSTVMSQGGVRIKGLIKTQQQVAEEQQQAQQAALAQTALEKGTAPAINQVGAATLAQGQQQGQ